MASSSQAGPLPQELQPSSLLHYGWPTTGEHGVTTPEFDIFNWYSHFQSCHRYFLDVAQHTHQVQALAAFINIQLPYQKHPFPITSSATASPHLSGPETGRHQRQPHHFSGSDSAGHPQAVSLVPYIRRLVATGHDLPRVLCGYFGDNWREGIGALHEIERQNYLFAAKSTSWMKVKQAYDMSPQEMVPFLKPLGNVTEKEIQGAEAAWSEWLAMQDWMLGPRAPDIMNLPPGGKRESQG
ncbi:Uncharacterized protein BP5553_09453 [Venustampulla echinocandica]|uniref:Ilp is an apoptosis inhibitor n=1 Tax=Venustampulla echinocandica TaxID=2656787 RepID=A0A370TCV3_9HELO|nr:Uncharacterized protein BP5553_09453 [Venustampulla echinocandica]RDL32051.1 Uncharacterized protein BP5553_09453 [Venustampulla echinocandica]